jgi:hypothetical protein
MPNWLADYLRGNFMAAVWQAALAFGGVLLAVHFLYIGFFPDLDWQASLALLAVVALTGICFLALLCLLLTFPSFTWTIFLEQLIKEHPARPLACLSDQEITMSAGEANVASSQESKAGDSKAELENRQDRKNRGTSELSWWKPGLLFGVPPAIFWSLFALAVSVWPKYAEDWPGCTMLVLFAAALATALLGYFAIGGKHALGAAFRPLALRYYIPAVGVGTIVSFVPLLLLYALARSRYNTSDIKLITFLAVAALGFLFNVTALQRWLADGHRRRALASFTSTLFVGALLLLGVVAATSNWVLLPEGVARLYGIGNVERAALILDKEGCAIAKALNLTTEPVPEAEMCRLPRVTILNRLGKTYYVESEGKTRFTLPAGTVKSDRLRE